jgi:hypothetical protein
MSVALRVPTTGRDRTARGVCFKPSFSSACATPGASLQTRQQGGGTSASTQKKLRSYSTTYNASETALWNVSK